MQEATKEYFHILMINRVIFYDFHGDTKKRKGAEAPDLTSHQRGMLAARSICMSMLSM